MISLSQPDLGEKEKQRVAAVIDRGPQLTRGSEVDAFESEFAQFCDTPHGIATTNGTSALHTACEALGLGRGDRIATTPFSFIASANAIRWCGAEPTFVDIREETYNLDLRELEARLRGGEQIDAVLAVHLFGLPCDMDHLCELAAEYEFFIVEDAAQAHGATYAGTPVGSFGDAACFSFFPSKNMVTGEGGMVVTNRTDVAERGRSFIEHGTTAEGYDGLGHNFCMPEITAAIGRIQLEKLPKYNEARRHNARRFTESLHDHIVPPIEPTPCRHVYHQYTIQSDARNTLRRTLAENGIASKAYYETPIHHQPAFSEYDVQLPMADRLSTRVLSLPVHPQLSSKEISHIVNTVNEHSP